MFIPFVLTSHTVLFLYKICSCRRIIPELLCWRCFRSGRVGHKYILSFPWGRPFPHYRVHLPDVQQRLISLCPRESSKTLHLARARPAEGLQAVDLHLGWFAADWITPRLSSRVQTCSKMHRVVTEETTRLGWKHCWQGSSSSRFFWWSPTMISRFTSMVIVDWV